MKPVFLIDTVIIIDHLNGIDGATSWLRNLMEGEAVISVITRAEVLTGASEEDRAGILLLLDSYECLPIKRQIADKAAELRKLKRWKLPDAFQAALCAYHNFKLVTRNTNDFDPAQHNFVFVPYTI